MPPEEIEISSSSTFEPGEDRIEAPHGKVDPGEIAIGVVIGRMSEFFDFFVYAIASALVFPQLFFPMVDRLTGTLYAFAIFALAFIARPIGSVLFTAIDRRHGRGVKLTIALFLLGGSTASISFLPGYGQLGLISIGLLAVCRIGQGLALAGTWDGLASLLAVNAPENRRGWYAMMPQLGAPLGFLLASGLFLYFIGSLSSTDFLAWGWRYPFFVAFAVNVVALFARLRLVETEQFSGLFEQDELKPVPVLTLLQREGRNVVIGAFAPLASFAMFHIVTVFPLSWVTLFTHEHATAFLRIEMLGAVIGILGIMASGVIADRINRRNHLALCALLIAGFSLLAPRLLNGGRWGEATFLLVGFAILGLSFGQSTGAVSSNFSRQFRYTGAAVTSDLSWLIGAGFAPLAALGLASRFGLPAVGAYLLSGAVCTLVALTINRRLTMVS
jgi:MFS family permease